MTNSVVIEPPPTGLGSVQAGVSPLEIEPRVSELARLLLEPDLAHASRFIDELVELALTPKHFFGLFIEPTARKLGDLWSEDYCTELDVTIGLCQLQSAMRRVNSRFAPVSMPCVDARSVLVAPQPGELHMLCAALDSEILWQAGWPTQCAFPPTDMELQDLLAKDGFDALDLSVSLSFRREHWLPRIARTIAGAREASRNPALAVVIGGTLFAEQPDLGDLVGADACVPSSIFVVETISQACGKRRQTRWKPLLHRT